MRRRRKIPSTIATAKELIAIRYDPVPSPPNTTKSNATIAGPRTVATLPTMTKNPINSVSFSDGERAMSRTGPSANVAPSARKRRGSATNNTQGAQAKVTAMIATSQSTSVARSVLLGLSLSETYPAPKAAKAEKISETSMRLAICWSDILKTSFAKRHTSGTVSDCAGRGLMSDLYNDDTLVLGFFV